MTAIALTATDVNAAANFLEQFLTDQVTDGDFTKGTALRDLTVQALASVVAFLRADAAQIRQMQSLVSVEAATGGDDEALQDAVTAILSNFFIAPKAGLFARGFAIGHSSQQVDVFISTSVVFTYAQGLTFVVDATDTYFIPRTELIPIIDSDSTVLDYEFRIPLVATAPGEVFNVTAGLFASFDRFSPYVTRVDSTDTFSGGKGVETVDEILARAPTAISVRNLINDRSIEATLEDNFDGIESIMVIGMGEPEMQRDLVPGVAPHLKFHVGGAVDIYLRTGLVETSFTGAVGDVFARPDGVASVFRDGTVDFIAAGVLPGDILRITDGFPSVPAEFLIVEIINTTTLVVSESSPFPVATDEAVPPTTVDYVIGRIGPTYSDVLSAGGLPLTTGLTSRSSSTSGRITLPGGPVMDILDVAVLDPLPAESLYESQLDGFVHFPNQVNTTPDGAATPDDGLQFQTVVHNPLFAQSALQWMEVVVGTDSSIARFDGNLLRVRYRTLQSFGTIDAFVRSNRERVAAAFQLPRGRNPVIVGMTLTYTLKATALFQLDDDAIAQAIIDFVNAFDSTSESIDVSSIIQLVKNAFPDIANIVPAVVGDPILTIGYTLRAPTGEVMSFLTTDAVEISPEKQTAGPSLVLLDLGASNRTLQYVANPISVIVGQAGA